ncbi:MAG: pantoate--beta-alanine ligase, partial [Candidatus Kapaibacterium sp.]
APALFHSLEEGRKAILQGERRRKIINAIMRKRISEEPKFKTDYLNAADADNLQEPEEFLPGDHIALLGACFMGTTRLIDNALVTVPGRLNENNFIEGI